MSLIPFKDDPSDENTIEWTTRQFRKISDFAKETVSQLIAHTGGVAPISPATSSSWNAHGNTATGAAASPLKIDAGSFIVNGTTGNAPTELATANTSFSWVPGLSALRAGTVSGTQWATIGQDSLALGNNTQATSANSAAIGALCVATGTNSFSAGYNSNASGFFSNVAIGNDAVAVNGVAVGVNADAITGLFPISVGFNASSSGNSTIAVGSNVVSSGASNSVAIGVGNDSTAIGATTLGVNIVSSATNALTIGIGAGGGVNRLVNNEANTAYLGVNSTEPTLILQNQRCAVVGTAKFAPLSTLDVGGSVGYQSKTITFADTPYTLSDELVLLVDTSGGDVTVNLPQISGVDRRMYHIKAIEYGTAAGTNDVIIHPFAGDFIDQNNPSTSPAATDIIIDRGDAVQLVADTAAATDTWWII